MAEVRKTASEARAEARTDWDRIDATTEADMQRHALEDGEDPDDDRPFVEPVDSIRRRLGMSQAQFAAAIHVPLRTIQNWEQKRTRPDRPALALLRILAREPEAALKALSAWRRNARETGRVALSNPGCETRSQRATTNPT